MQDASGRYSDNSNNIMQCLKKNRDCVVFYCGMQHLCMQQYSLGIHTCRIHCKMHCRQEALQDALIQVRAHNISVDVSAPRCIYLGLWVTYSHRSNNGVQMYSSSNSPLYRTEPKSCQNCILEKRKEKQGGRGQKLNYQSGNDRVPPPTDPLLPKCNVMQGKMIQLM